MSNFRHRPPSPLGRDPKIALRPIIGTDGRVPKSAQPWPMEPAYLHMYLSGGEPDFPEPTEPWHQAQEIAYRGWEENSANGRKRAVQKALEISLEAPDPYLLAAHDASSWKEALELELKALDAAEGILGEGPFEELEGEFWKVAITRPYMRARFALGYTYWQLDERENAQDHFQALLDLNPDDNQSARHVLTAILLCLYTRSVN